MARCSNGLLGLLNAGVLVLALVVLGGGIWLSHRAATTDCERFLERPVIALGALLLALSLAGLAGSLCRASCLLWLYLVALFILIALLLVFTVFAFVVTNRGAGSVVSGRGYKEYLVGEYSTWLQRRVENSGNWAKIRSCLHDGNVCQKLGARRETLQQFVTNNLSPIQDDGYVYLTSGSACGVGTDFEYSVGPVGESWDSICTSCTCDISVRMNNCSPISMLDLLQYKIVACWYLTSDSPCGVGTYCEYSIGPVEESSDFISAGCTCDISVRANNGSSIYVSGCCKPPTGCNFTYQSETVWIKPPGLNSTDDPDCNTWSNDQNVLCYDCQSCKAGVLANLRNDWKKIATVNIIFLIFLIIVYSVGCCAFRNNRQDNSYPAWK